MLCYGGVCLLNSINPINEIDHHNSLSRPGTSRGLCALCGTIINIRILFDHQLPGILRRRRRAMHQITKEQKNQIHAKQATMSFLVQYAISASGN